MKTLILDTESNGMRPEQLCQLSYIIAENGSMTGRNFFFTVTCMNEYAQKKHGFSKQRLFELSRGRSFVDQLDEFRADFEGVDLICGHNVSSDTRMLKLAFSDAGITWTEPRKFCTMAHFDNAMHLKSKTGAHKPPRLDELCRYFCISQKEIEKYCVHKFGPNAYRAHDARYDAAATALCIMQAQERGDIRGVI